MGKRNRIYFVSGLSLSRDGSSRDQVGMEEESKVGETTGFRGLSGAGCKASAL